MVLRTVIYIHVRRCSVATAREVLKRIYIGVVGFIKVQPIARIDLSTITFLPSYFRLFYLLFRFFSGLW